MKPYHENGEPPCPVFTPADATVIEDLLSLTEQLMRESENETHPEDLAEARDLLARISQSPQQKGGDR